MKLCDCGIWFNSSFCETGFCYHVTHTSNLWRIIRLITNEKVNHTHWTITFMRWLRTQIKNDWFTISSLRNINWILKNTCDSVCGGLLLLLASLLIWRLGWARRLLVGWSHIAPWTIWLWSCWRWVHWFSPSTSDHLQAILGVVPNATAIVALFCTLGISFAFSFLCLSSAFVVAVVVPTGLTFSTYSCLSSYPSGCCHSYLCSYLFPSTYHSGLDLQDDQSP